MRFTRLIATAATAAVLGTAGVSIAGATSEPSGSEPAAATAAAPSTDSAPPAEGTEAPDAANGERRNHRRKAAKAAVTSAAETIGITAEALLAELKAGKTIAEVATANGVDPQAVIDALVAKANERIDAALAADKLTAEEAARAKEKIAAQIAKRVNEGRPRDGKDKAGDGEGTSRRKEARRAGAQATADAIGISPAELAQEVKSGKTIAEIATAHGVDPQAVIDALVAAAYEKIEAAESSGKISAERAAKAKERVSGAVAQRVNEGRKRR